MNIGALICMQVATQTAVRTLQNSIESQRKREEQQSVEVGKSPCFERTVDEMAESKKVDKNGAIF